MAIERTSTLGSEYTRITNDPVTVTVKGKPLQVAIVDKPLAVYMQPDPTPPSQSKDPTLTDGSWRKEMNEVPADRFPLVNSKQIKKLLDVI